MQTESLLTEILGHLDVAHGPDRRAEYVAWCPFHADGQGQPPHKPDLKVSERGWYCHVCKRGGSLSKLAQELGITMNAHSRSKIVATYDYTDEHGTLLYQSVRLDPKDFRLRRPIGNDRWDWNLNGTRRVAYRLRDLMAHPGEVVFVVEGEKDTNRLWGLGLVATTNAMGAGNWRPEYSEELRDRNVIILPDNDPPGEKHALAVADSLTNVAASVRILRLPGLLHKGDVSDWLNSGHTIAELKSLADAATRWSPPAGGGNGLTASEDPPKPRSKRSQADVLVDLADEGGIELAKDSRGETICLLPVSGHREVWPCSDRHVKAWLTRRFADSEGRVPNLTALSTAVNSLDAQARLGDRVIEVHNRVAGDESEIWIDLSGPAWDAVRVTPKGWEIVAQPDVAFRRYNHQLAQARPIPGGTIDELLEFVNVQDEQQRLLLKVYVVSCFIPGIPHPICVFHGPQGSAKTTITRILGMLIDPSLTPTMALPQEPDRLV